MDFLTKKQKVNEGEVPQYYVEGSHPAIISAMDFDRVQAEIARRQRLGRSYSGSSIFASKLICGDCGGFYGKKVWHSTDAYRREVWRCNGKFNGEAKCETPTLTTEGIQQMFLQAYNQLMGNREQIIQACEVMRSVVSDCSKLDTEIDALNEEIQVVAGLVNQCIKENATTQQSQEEYNKKYNRLVKRYLNNMMTERSVDRDNGVLDYCRLHEITIQAWSPLQFGMFKGCFVDHPDFPELNRVLGELGNQYGVSKTAIAIAWILRHPARMQAIVGTMNPQHLKDICAASKVNLTHHEWYELYLASGKYLP